MNGWLVVNVLLVLWMFGAVGFAVVFVLARRDEKVPISARTVCGHLVFGESVGDLIANEIHHADLCGLAKEGAA